LTQPTARRQLRVSQTPLLTLSFIGSAYSHTGLTKERSWGAGLVPVSDGL